MSQINGKKVLVFSLRAVIILLLIPLALLPAILIALLILVDTIDASPKKVMKHREVILNAQKDSTNE